MQLLIVMILHVLVAVALVVLVLVQRGKGSEMGAAFGASASGTMFGAQGSTPFMVKLVAGLAVVFFCTTLALNYMVSKGGAKQTDILDLTEAPVQQSAPVNSTNNKQELPSKSQEKPNN
ncbi:MAG: preprotein translocase subunit SecG [Gammaproteobacteria bacterium]|nr:preprotein translocase subunit SecG [Gammaproteobacteria bacterium]